MVRGGGEVKEQLSAGLEGGRREGVEIAGGRGKFAERDMVRES